LRQASPSALPASGGNFRVKAELLAAVVAAWKVVRSAAFTPLQLSIANIRRINRVADVEAG